MKKLYILLIIAMMLSGCRGPEVFETMNDLYYQPPMQKPAQVQIKLPEDAALATVSGEAGQLYLCQDYTVAVQTMAAGDLSATLQDVTGYNAQQLQMVTTEKEGLTRYTYAWACAGESGDGICRGVTLDDGCFHYTLTIMGSAEQAADMECAWQEIMDSFHLCTGQ